MLCGSFLYFQLSCVIFRGGIKLSLTVNTAFELFLTSLPEGIPLPKSSVVLHLSVVVLLTLLCGLLSNSLLVVLYV